MIDQLIFRSHRNAIFSFESFVQKIRTFDQKVFSGEDRDMSESNNILQCRHSSFNK